MRRRLGWRAGLRFGGRDSGGGYGIASRHWPHKLCWDWYVDWQFHRRGTGCARRIGVLYAYRNLSLMLGFGSLTLAWQDYRDMVAERFKDEAPVVRYPWGGIGGGNRGRLPACITKILEDADDG